jgi:glyoxylase-like metal-dependent hydrolase (beta-lactamase superfamily II)
MMLGDFEVTVVSDGSTYRSSAKEMLHGIDAKDTGELLARAFEQDSIPWTFNCFLINTGKQLVLIDTGIGSGMGAAAGNLVRNMRAAGYQPEQVDEVLLTHFHPDHSGGLVVDGNRTFPNATIRANKLEAEFWLSKSNLDKAPAAMQPYFQGALAALKPYTENGQFKPFLAATTEVVPGITARAAAGLGRYHPYWRRPVSEAAGNLCFGHRPTRSRSIAVAAARRCCAKRRAHWRFPPAVPWPRSRA